jgi:lysophospholipase L1-like esterase
MRTLFLLLLAFLSFSCSETDFPPVNDQLNNPDDTVRVIPRYLALGDSYTIGQSVDVADRWPIQLAARLTDTRLAVDSTRIIATTGWTTANLINAIDNAALEPEYDMVSLLIGVNNQYQGRNIDEYRTQFEQLLQTSIALARGDKSHVFVVSIPDYGFTPFGQNNQASISQAIDQFNAVNREITEAYGVAYYDITPISREGLERPEMVASDGLHPSGVQYGEWVESFYQQVADQY